MTSLPYRPAFLAAAVALTLGVAGCGIRGPLEPPPASRAGDPGPGGGPGATTGAREPAPRPATNPAAQRSAPPLDWLIN